MTGEQGARFVQGEGDEWFRRNAEHMQAWQPENDLPLQLLSLYQIKASRALEVGASTGYRMEALRQRLGCSVVATDCSVAAMAAGARLYPETHHVVSEAHRLGFPDQSFDLIVANFVLHWLDRKDLLTAVADLDRVLQPGGFLVIGDFLPHRPWKVPYHHVQDTTLYTYKQDYPSIFTASGLYERVGHLTSHHARKGAPVAGADEHDRIGVTLLRKSPSDGFYSEAPPPTPPTPESD